MTHEGRQHVAAAGVSLQPAEVRLKLGGTHLLMGVLLVVLVVLQLGPGIGNSCLLRLHL